MLSDSNSTQNNLRMVKSSGSISTSKNTNTHTEPTENFSEPDVQGGSEFGD